MNALSQTSKEVFCCGKKDQSTISKNKNTYSIFLKSRANKVAGCLSKFSGYYTVGFEF